MSPSRETETGTIREAVVHFFKVERRHLVYLKFILEAYEGMSTLSTVEKTGAIVRLSIPPEFETDIMDVMAALSNEIPISPVNFESGEVFHA